MRIFLTALIFLSTLPVVFSQIAEEECLQATEHCGPLFDIPCIPSCLVAECGTTPPTPVGNPYLYEGECQIAIERYLSRASDVLGLDRLINRDINPTKEEKEEYCTLIKTLANLDIQFIQRAYPGGANQEHQLYCNKWWFETGYQIVRDINYAYDCAGKRRPIIQGMVYEFANYENFGKNEQYQNWIPSWVVDYYFSQFPEELDMMDPQAMMTYREYYYLFQEETNQWIVNETNWFKGCRIMTDGIVKDGAGNYIPFLDITKLEMRMWFLYQAMVQIDMGYTALHMGLYYEYAKNDIGYDKLYALTNAIRNYATEQNKFVLLSGETPVGESAKWGNSDQFIFDFDSRAMRPREIFPPSTLSVSPDGDCGGSGQDYPVDPQVILDYMASPCNNVANPAIVDPCTINSYGGSVSGISPLGCYVEQLPYTVHFDGFSSSESHIASGGPSSLTYGYNDHAWFHMLPEDCKAWWYDYFYCTRRNYHGGHGYIVIPGMIHYGNSQLNPISGNPILLDILASSTLKPQEDITADVSLVKCIRGGYACVDNCNGVSAPPGKKIVRGRNQYQITVENPDCSSIYSIHIIDPNGNYLPQEIGDTLLFIPPIDGFYTIKIRQDNLALLPDTYGTQEIQLPPYYMQAYCCNNVINADLCKDVYVFTNCISKEGEPVRKYEYYIEPLDSAIHINGVLSVSLGANIISSLMSARSVSGIIQTTDTTSAGIDFLLDVTIDDNVLEDDNLIVSGVLDDCEESDQRSELAVNTKHSRLKIFPNPSDGQISILIPYIKNEDSVIISIIDVLGRIVFVKNTQMFYSNEIRLDLDQLNSGTYFLNIKTETISTNAKFVIKK